MNCHFRAPLVATLAAGLTLTSFGFAAQAAPSRQPQVQDAGASIALSARKRHHHVRYHRSGERAALRAFGMIAGTIAGLAAADAWRDRCGYYDCGYYGGYYDYAPRYYYRPHLRHHHWRHHRHHRSVADY